MVTTVVAAALAGTSAATPAGYSAVRPVASYPITASFEVEYGFGWATGEESTDPCAVWQTVDGHVSVHARSVATATEPFQGFLVVNRPKRAVHHARAQRNIPIWGQLAAVGKASGTVLRTLTYAGGPRGCPGVASYVPPRTDCRLNQPFVASRAGSPASLVSAFRPYIRPDQEDSLDYSKHTSTRLVASGRDLVVAPFTGFRQTILLSVQPDRQIYRICPTTPSAPAYPTFVALDITPADWRALARLSPGGKRTIGPRVMRGECEAELAFQECTYRLSVAVTIRRTV